MQYTKSLVHRFILLASLLALLIALPACSSDGQLGNTGADSSISSSSSSASEQGTHNSSLTNTDDTLALLFEDQESGVQVGGEGTVLRLLEDDIKGDAHQRFILELKSGQTLLVAHNIDVASRLDGLAVGDLVQFYGEYYYNEQGGGIHWTHHDSSGKHEDGWLYWNNKYYE